MICGSVGCIFKFDFDTNVVYKFWKQYNEDDSQVDVQTEFERELNANTLLRDHIPLDLLNKFTALQDGSYMNVANTLISKLIIAHNRTAVDAVDPKFALSYRFINGKTLTESMKPTNNVLKSIQAVTRLRPFCRSMTQKEKPHIWNIDLHADNILIDANGNPYIIDFAEVKIVDDISTKIDDLTNILKQNQNTTLLEMLDKLDMNEVKLLRALLEVKYQPKKTNVEIIEIIEIFLNTPNTGGSLSKSKVRILGRERNIILQGRVQYCKYLGELRKLSELRKLEKQRAKEKQNI